MKYYILIGKDVYQSHPRFEMIFGDYDKECVKDERDASHDEWINMQILVCQDGTDKTIEAMIIAANT